MRHKNPEICHTCRHSPCKCKMTELEQLRADLEAMDRVQGLVFFGEEFKRRFYEKKKSINDRIAQLEAEADPWRKAKDIINTWCDRSCLESDLYLVANFVGHLEDTIAELKKQNVDLQSIIDEFGQYNE